TSIAEADRSYVAAEITAFLTAWLSSLTCPVVNRPRDGCLSGPNWSVERWIMTAARLGIPVREFRRTVTLRPPSTHQSSTNGLSRVVVVGGEIISSKTTNGDRRYAAWRLARTAGVDLLSARFDKQGMVDATCWPDLSDATTFEAVTRYFNGAGA